MSSKELWSGIPVWWPPQDPKGKPYRTKYVSSKFDPETGIVTVVIELIPARQRTEEELALEEDWKDE